MGEYFNFHVSVLMIYLKQLQNYNKKLFLCHHKNSRKQNQHFKLPFFQVYLDFGTSN